MKSIIILGAGYAGVLTAKKLAKRLKEQDVKITLIDKNRYHTMLTELHEVAANRVEEDSIRISLKRIFAGRQVELKFDLITSIDYSTKTLTGKNGIYKYDYLVLALGSKPAFFGIPGAEEFTYKLWSYDDAVTIKEHILQMFRKASIEEPHNIERQKYLTFYIIGAGFTGVEMAGELAEWAPFLCDEFEIARNEVKIVNVDILDRVVPMLPENLSAKARKRMERMGVTVMLKTGVAAVGNGFIELSQGDKLQKHDTKTVIWTAGVESSDVIKNSSKLIQAGRGRIKTDEFLRAQGDNSVFVAGDNLFFIPEGEKIARAANGGEL